ncbi:CBS domain-containing protein [Virgibacillus dakarensis]|uniref:CBS domain-containing protein n=1 Tax=Lentibacillus populi TaxID=1827502 RepID=A0A9W5U256_9BACI|nr:MULTISPECIES: cyclic-di-AMP-binding protein CbpB [Bacillaceae]MBT2216202.1 CBS domain-containing protein [Virgibacillus dakarensis]MTW85415.1 CBS domain-containing protein [Virgibacillus dakarensis]GGB63495.1 CBS domain-containing protein [Lentibacillus populi]
MSTIQDKQLTDIMIEEVMIPSEKVAHVQVNNPLEHALLVLVKSGYSAVPVLDAEYKLAGTIGKTIILNQILGLERFEFEKLADMRVHEVMNVDIPRLTKEKTFMDGLNTVINYPFVCVADEEGYFDGIVTRRAILKQLKRDQYRTKA